MEISLVALIVLVVIGFGVSKSYENDDGRLPSSRTKEGKKARLILGSIVIGCAISLYLYQFGNNSFHLSRFWLVATFVAVGLPILRYLESRKKHKK